MIAADCHYMISSSKQNSRLLWEHSVIIVLSNKKQPLRYYHLMWYSRLQPRPALPSAPLEKTGWARGRRRRPPRSGSGQVADVVADALHAVVVVVAVAGAVEVGLEAVVARLRYFPSLASWTRVVDRRYCECQS